MFLAILVILTYPKRNYLEVFFSYLLFRFKIALWCHQVILVHLIITKKDAPWSKNSKNVKIMRFEPRNPKLWQFEDLKLLSSATRSSNSKANTLFKISKEFSTRIINFIVFEEKKIQPSTYAIFNTICGKCLVANDASCDGWHFNTTRVKLSPSLFELFAFPF